MNKKKMAKSIHDFAAVYKQDSGETTNDSVIVTLSCGVIC